MKVWVVTGGDGHEYGWFTAVCLTEERAKQYVKNQGCGGYEWDIEEVEVEE